MISYEYEITGVEPASETVPQLGIDGVKVEADYSSPFDDRATIEVKHRDPAPEPVVTAIQEAIDIAPTDAAIFNHVVIHVAKTLDVPITHVSMDGIDHAILTDAGLNWVVLEQMVRLSVRRTEGLTFQTVSGQGLAPDHDGIARR